MLKKIHSNIETFNVSNVTLWKFEEHQNLTSLCHGYKVDPRANMGKMTGGYCEQFIYNTR